MHYEPLKKHNERGTTGIAVLVDPDNADEQYLDELMTATAGNEPDYYFIGGSLLTGDRFHQTVELLKSKTEVPIVIFPGSLTQISNRADAFLLLSLISGRNPELLIGDHVKAAPALKSSKLNVWPTGYLLIEGGKSTTASYISNTSPIPKNKPEIAATTALAGEMLGMKIIYLDSGSGADFPVSPEMITAVKKTVALPVITGGGINTPQKAEAAAAAGADLIVIGNVLEKSPEVYQSIRRVLQPKKVTTAQN